MLRADKLRVHLGGEHLPARLVEPVHRAGALELVRELSRGRGASLGLAERGNDLPACDRAHISAPRLRRDPQGLLRGAELGGCELIAAILVRAGMVRSDNRLPMICRSMSSSTGVDTSERSKVKARRPARLDGKRLGDAEPVIGGLKPEIVEERDLHCRVGAERTVQQPRHPRSHRCFILRRADLNNILVQAGAGDHGHGVHPAVRREGAASAERGCRRDDRREAHAPKVREHGSSLVCR